MTGAAADRSAPVIVVLMGVSGCGKSTVGAIVAAHLGWPFAEGDDLHPPQNLAKMAAGRPLDDTDRAPWLARIREWIAAREAVAESAVVTCSALRRRYRDMLRDGGADPSVRFVHLAGTREQLLERLSARRSHFMPAALLDSQLAELEPPQPDEPAITVHLCAPPQVQARTVLRELGLD